MEILFISIVVMMLVFLFGSISSSMETSEGKCARGGQEAINRINAGAYNGRSYADMDWANRNGIHVPEWNGCECEKCCNY